MAEATAGEGWVVVEGDSSGFAQQWKVGRHRLPADEPVAAGGTDTGPSPYDILCAALGTCTSMTISLYARRKEWPLRSVTVHLRHSKIHASDCADCETKVGRLDRIEREIVLTGELSDEQRAQLMGIADKCPVHRTLTSEISIVSRERR
jgi:putative redox protein